MNILRILVRRYTQGMMNYEKRYCKTMNKYEGREDSLKRRVAGSQSDTILMQNTYTRTGMNCFVDFYISDQ